MKEQQSNMNTKIRPGLSWNDLDSLNATIEPYINNKSYKSVKIMNQPVNEYYYHYVLFFYNDTITHMQIFPSSINNESSDNHVLNSWVNNQKVELLRLWKTIEIVHDKKINSSYIICR
jgi:hypothetical protein